MLGVYLRSARYYRASQVAARLGIGAKSVVVRNSRWFVRRYAAPPGLARDPNARFVRIAIPQETIDLQSLKETAARLEKGVFRFLNQDRSLGFPVDWKAPGSTRLWRYNLHYFEYALDLALLARWLNDATCTDLLNRLFQDWIAANHVGDPVGWHSYPIARRIVKWIQAVNVVSPEVLFPDTQKEAAWQASLYTQAKYLEDFLEFDCRGNHLLANGKALIFAGTFFGQQTGRRWFQTGQRILWRGLEEQILPDGGHHERSPMYHAIVLQDYLEIVLLFQLNGIPVPGWVRGRLISMADFLAGVRHPDGEIPLFGDSAFRIAHPPQDILAAAERLLNVRGRWNDATPGLYCSVLAPEPATSRPSTAAPIASSQSWPVTGYYKMCGSTPGDQLIVDALPIGPDHLPAHGHCSLLSYELSLGGKRLIVDSGVEEYQPGSWRNFWRSTRAHNTVVVDSAEQSEIWASFRAGRRARSLESKFLQTESASLFIGQHDGFVGQSSPTPHRRYIACLPCGMWLIMDEITGTGHHVIESFVHLAPEAECHIRDRYADVTLNSINVRLHLYHDPAVILTSVRGHIDPIQGWYAPEFGKRQPNTVLKLTAETTLPVKIGYLVVPQDREIDQWTFEVDSSSLDSRIDISVHSLATEIRESFKVDR